MSCNLDVQSTLGRVENALSSVESFRNFLGYAPAFNPEETVIDREVSEENGSVIYIKKSGDLLTDIFIEKQMEDLVFSVNSDLMRKAIKYTEQDGFFKIDFNVTEEDVGKLNNTTPEENEMLFDQVQSFHSPRNKTSVNKQFSGDVTNALDVLLLHNQKLIDNIDKRLQSERSKLNVLQKSNSNGQNNTKIEKVKNVINNLLENRKKVEELNDIASERSLESAYVEILEHIKFLKDTLDNPDHIDLATVKTSLEFYSEYLLGRNIHDNKATSIPNLSDVEHEYITTLVKEFNDVVNKFNKFKSETSKKIESSDVYVKRAKKKLTKKDFEHFASVDSDISHMSTYLFGTTTTFERDGFLPQIIKNELQKNILHFKGEFQEKFEKIEQLAKKFKDKDLDFLYAKTRRGQVTGDFIQPFSDKFIKLQSELYRKLKETPKHREAFKIYRDWMGANAEPINFFKLGFVKDMFEGVQYNNPQEGMSFDFSTRYFAGFDQKEADKYEQELKAKLGLYYDEYVESVKAEVTRFINNYVKGSSNFQQMMSNNPFEGFMALKSGQSILNVEIQGENKRVFIRPNILPYIPKKQTGSSKLGTLRETRFYNESFNEILKDKDKYELWKEITNLYKTVINPTYNISGSTIGKVDEAIYDFSITDLDFKDLSGTYKKIEQHAKHKFRTTFNKRQNTNKDIGDSIVANYSDNSADQIRYLVSIYKDKSDTELIALARSKGINVTENALNEEEKIELAKDIAYNVVNNKYSKNLFQTTFALLELVSEQKGREMTLPIAEILLEEHSKKLDKHGNVRTRSISKLTSFIEVVIKNNPNVVSEELTREIKMDDKQKEFVQKILKGREVNLKALTDVEKELKREYTELLNKDFKEVNFKPFEKDGYIYKKEEVNGVVRYLKGKKDEVKQVIDEAEIRTAYHEHLNEKIDSLGIPATAGSIITGIMKLVIYHHMAYNPVAGFMNRLEGEMALNNMDQTGNYWTIGNNDRSKSFLSFANSLLGLKEFMPLGDLKRVKELQKVSLFIEQTGLVQDKKDPFARGTASVQRLKRLGKYTGAYDWSIGLAEFKNQGQVILNMLQDTYVQGSDGKMYQVFDGNSLQIYDLVDGKLVLKDMFKYNADGTINEKNVNNWGKFKVSLTDEENNDYLDFHTKTRIAITRSQGNYDSLDYTKISDTVLGNTIISLKRWMPEAIAVRFLNNDNYSLAFNKKENKGYYRVFLEKGGGGALIPFFSASLWSVGVATGGVGLIGLGAVSAGYLAYRVFKNSQGSLIKSLTTELKQIAGTFLTITSETAKGPFRLLGLGKFLRDRIGWGDRPGLQWAGFDEETAPKVAAAASEIANGLTILGLAISTTLMGMKLFDIEDEEEEKRLKFLLNKIDQLRTGQDMYKNPVELYNASTSFALVQWVFGIVKTLKLFFEGEFEEAGSTFLEKNVFAPKILKHGFSHYSSDKRYNPMAGSGYDNFLVKYVNPEVYFGETNEAVRDQIKELALEQLDDKKSRMYRIVQSEMRNNPNLKDKSEKEVAKIIASSIIRKNGGYAPRAKNGHKPDNQNTYIATQLRNNSRAIAMELGIDPDEIKTY